MKLNWIAKMVMILGMSAMASIWACRLAHADVLTLNLPGGKVVSIGSLDLKAVGYLDVENWRELSGLETTLVSYQGVGLCLAGIFTAPDKASAGLDITYNIKTTNAYVTSIQTGIWAGNDVYIQNGRFINMFGIKASIGL